MRNWNEETIQGTMDYQRGWLFSRADLKRQNNENMLDAHPYTHNFI